MHALNENDESYLNEISLLKSGINSIDIIICYQKEEILKSETVISRLQICLIDQNNALKKFCDERKEMEEQIENILRAIKLNSKNQVFVDKIFGNVKQTIIDHSIFQNADKENCLERSKLKRMNTDIESIESNSKNPKISKLNDEPEESGKMNISKYSSQTSDNSSSWRECSPLNDERNDVSIGSGNHTSEVTSQNSPYFDLVDRGSESENGQTRRDSVLRGSDDGNESCASSRRREDSWNSRSRRISERESHLSDCNYESGVDAVDRGSCEDYDNSMSDGGCNLRKNKKPKSKVDKVHSRKHVHYVDPEKVCKRQLKLPIFRDKTIIALSVKSNTLDLFAGGSNGVLLRYVLGKTHRYHTISQSAIRFIETTKINGMVFVLAFTNENILIYDQACSKPQIIIPVKGTNFVFNNGNQIFVVQKDGSIVKLNKENWNFCDQSYGKYCQSRCIFPPTSKGKFGLMSRMNDKALYKINEFNHNISDVISGVKDVSKILRTRQGQLICVSKKFCWLLNMDFEVIQTWKIKAGVKFVDVDTESLVTCDSLNTIRVFSLRSDNLGEKIFRQTVSGDITAMGSYESCVYVAIGNTIFVI